MPRVIFLRHGARPPRPASGTAKPDALTTIGEAQSRAAGALLHAHGLTPVLGIHTRTARTADTLRLALSALDVPMRSVSGGPSSLSGLADRARKWAAGLPRVGPVVLCAHHSTQHMLCRALGLRVDASQRSLIVVDVPMEPTHAPQLVLAWCCLEDESAWRPVFPT